MASVFIGLLALGGFVFLIGMLSSREAAKAEKRDESMSRAVGTRGSNRVDESARSPQQMAAAGIGQDNLVGHSQR
jgi:hypothetical protein